MKPDESTTAQRKPYRRKNAATFLRLDPAVAAALERDARETGETKSAIVEGELRDRYGLGAAA